MSGHRQERIEALIGQTISTMLIRGDIKDPRVDSSLAVNSVSVAKDLSWAKIGLAGFLEEKRLEKGVAGMNSAAGYIQSQLAKVLQTRLTPRLNFFADTSVRDAFAMTKKIEELLNDKPSAGDDPSQ